MDNRNTVLNEISRTFDISKLEKKSMVERALKLSEECGEVAEAVLSEQQACGCSYKNKSKHDIAEECVDVIIIALSIIESAGYEIEGDLIELYKSKLDKWERKIKG